MSDTIKYPLIVLVGPTAVGKTALSVQLAQVLNAEIISADSRLFYRGMDIGTAKPTEEEMGSIMHHMIDNIAPDEPYSLGEYLKTVRKLIPDIWARGKLPMLVGGTGQYVRGITEGWIVPEQEPDLRFRNYFNQINLEKGYMYLHDILNVLDPSAAEKIDPTNVRRTIRALEVIYCSGTRFSTQKRREAPPYEIVQIGLNRPRPELYERIDVRVDQMLEMGLEKEILSLLQQGFANDLPAFSAIGYKQIIDYLSGEYDLTEAVRLIKSKTHQFVRRQANWFKVNDPDIHWFHPEEITAQQIGDLVMEKMDI